VGPGAKVTVKNQDAENHTVTSVVKGAFDVTAEAGGKPASFTAPTKPGSYPFGCSFHANMKGNLVVK
jgi:plastocyanin